TVTLTLVRDGETMDLEVNVGPAEQTAAAPQPGADESEDTFRALDGAELTTADPADPRFDGQRGVVVTNVRPGSAAARNGLRPNDLIAGVNRSEVASVQELNAALEQTSGPVALRIE